MTRAERMIRACDLRIDAISAELRRARPGFDAGTFIGWGNAWASHEGLHSFRSAAFERRNHWVEARNAATVEAKRAAYAAYRKDIAWGQRAETAKCEHCGSTYRVAA